MHQKFVLWVSPDSHCFRGSEREMEMVMGCRKHRYGIREEKRTVAQ